MGCHLNCIDKSMQFKWIPTTYAFIKKVDKKYTGYKLKITKLLDCALIGVCAVIRSITVSQVQISFYWKNSVGLQLGFDRLYRDYSQVLARF